MALFFNSKYGNFKVCKYYKAKISLLANQSTNFQQQIILRQYNMRMEGEQIPDAFACPICQQLMQQPVIATDGHTYERTKIQQWFQRGNKTSPMTGQQLKNTDLIPNHALWKAIQEYKHKINYNIKPKIHQYQKKEDFAEKKYRIGKCSHCKYTQKIDADFQICDFCARIQQKYAELEKGQHKKNQIKQLKNSDLIPNHSSIQQIQQQKKKVFEEKKYRIGKCLQCNYTQKISFDLGICDFCTRVQQKYADKLLKKKQHAKNQMLQG